MINSFDLKDKTFLITGVANKKSVAYAAAKTLEKNGAAIVLSVQSQAHIEKVSKLFPQSPLYICDVEDDEQIDQLGKKIANDNIKLDGLLHSIAFANFSFDSDNQMRPFHETKTKDFLQAVQISCFSLSRLAASLMPVLNIQASVVTIGISNTLATNYGFLGPIKAMLQNSCAYLAKGFSKETRVRFNTVSAGPLKTSASAGIPGYVENYLFAEKLTLRKEALKTQEVANTIVFLLSPLSSGINASVITVDAGINCNYFDQDLVQTAMKQS